MTDSKYGFGPIEKRFAIFIGASEYKTLDSLPGVNNDIEELTRIILPAFDKVVTFTNQSLSAIDKEKHDPRKILDTASVIAYFDDIKKEFPDKYGFVLHRDLIWIHFSGHGIQHDGKPGWVFYIDDDCYGKETSYDVLFGFDYLTKWFNQVFLLDDDQLMGRVIVTVSACREYLSKAGGNTLDLVDQANIKGMYLIGASSVGGKTVIPTTGRSDLVNHILTIIHEHKTNAKMPHEDITIKILREQLRKIYSQAVDESYQSSNIADAILIPIEKIKYGRYDRLLIDTQDSSLFIRVEEARFSSNWRGSRSIDELQQIFKQCANRQSEILKIPLFLYWRGKARTVGFHLYINNKIETSINLDEFITCLNATGHKEIVLWLDCDLTAYDIWCLIREKPELCVITTDDTQRTDILSGHCNKFIKEWCAQYQSDRYPELKSILLATSEGLSIHVSFKQ